MRVLSTSVHGLEMPVDECPHSARGACPFLCPWSALCSCLLLHMYKKSVQYCTTVQLYSSVLLVQKKTTTTTNHGRNSI